MQYKKLFVVGLIAVVATLFSSFTVFAEDPSIFDSLPGGVENPAASQGGLTVSVVGSPNPAVTFNSNEHPNPCDDSACDNDLRIDQGIFVIVREDGTSPGTQNDRATGGTLTFTFSVPVTLNSFELVDNEEDGSWYSVNGGAAVGIAGSGSNGSVQTIAVGATDVTSLVVKLRRSGAVDDLSVDVPQRGTQGCTPGFWKIKGGKADNIAALWAQAGINPDATFSATFGVAGVDIALRDAVEAKGGGANALIRHSTAALLNAAHSGVDYPYFAAEIISMVQSAFASNNFEGAKNTLAAANESGCSLNASGK